MKLRLHKFIADCGVTSRRKAELLITAGRVKVNGTAVTELGSKVDPSQDEVEVDGNLLDPSVVEKVYVVLNKPKAYLCTVSDPEGRPLVLDLLPDFGERIYPVGRLDYLSEGLLVLTNDGEVAHQIMHPSFQLVKVYEVKVFGRITLDLLKALRGSHTFEEGTVQPLSVRIIKELPQKTWLEFRLGEGKNREVRRICESLDIVVERLRRVSIGGLTCDDIAPGNYKVYTKKKLLSELRKDNVKGHWSDKKSLHPGKKSLETTSPANAPGFQRFKKETYYQTIQEIKLKKTQSKAPQ